MNMNREVRLPRRAQYVKVRLDADMVPEGPLLNGGWWPPGRVGVFTFHSFDRNRLRPGDRVCVNGGEFEDVFGTVLGKHRCYRGASWGVRRVRTKTIKFEVTTEQTAEVEVA